MGVAIRDEGKKVNSNINVTPMVDVMLVLLIIFMVITPMLQNKVAITLAQVENPQAMPDADKEDELLSRLLATEASISARTRSIPRCSAAWCAISSPTRPTK